MADATTEFFEDLGARGHEPLLERANGTMRIELSNGKRRARWLVTLKKGDVTVSHANAKADCVVRMDQALFDQIVSGRENAIAALLRGLVAVEGNRQLLVLFQRLFRDRRREGSSHERARSDPRRQHVRRQRLARRHRGVAHRSDRPVLVRHAASSRRGS